MKQLDLNTIAEDVLDETFIDKEALDTISDDIEVEESVSPPSHRDNVSTKRPSGITNEYLLREIRDGINVKKNIDLLVRYNYGLIVDIARRCTCYIPYEDKIQYGVEGFMNAIHKFDLDRGINFSTYATSSVRQTVYNRANDMNRIVGLPRYMSVHNVEVQKFITNYVTKNGRFPNEVQIHEGTGIELAIVKRLVQFNSNTCSLDIRKNEDSELTLQDTMAGETMSHHLDAATLSDPFTDIMDILNCDLDPAEKELVARVHGICGYEEETLRGIVESGYIDAKGKEVNSRSAIHRRYNDIMEKIRKLAAKHGLEMNF